MLINRICDTLNGIEINVYELNESKQEVNQLFESYLIGKIKSMKIHKDLIVDDVFNVPILRKEYISKISRKIQEINTPEYHKLNWFDVRRSRVTEFMSQFLLEKEYKCTFFEKADKRIKLEP